VQTWQQLKRLWLAQRGEDSEAEVEAEVEPPGWVGLRLGRLADWEGRLLGPGIQLPRILARLWPGR
jgi:hypothetical protein